MSLVDKKLSNSVCESCGKEFSCGAEIGKCWCFEVSLAEKSLAKISRDYANCLCRECLLEYNKNQNSSE